MTSREEKEFFLEFIELYRSFPALWDSSTKEYSDKKIKHKQYKILLEKFNEWYPGAPLEAMKRKINTMRTSYRRELRRLGFSSKSENSTLYYYKAFQFLRKCETPNASAGNTSYSSSCGDGSIGHRTLIKRKKLRDSVEDDILALAKKELCKPTDDLDRLGETWASKMRKMDRHQQLWAEKFINEILLEGQLGNLQRHTVQIVECITSPDNYDSKEMHYNESIVAD